MTGVEKVLYGMGALLAAYLVLTFIFQNWGKTK